MMRRRVELRAVGILVVLGSAWIVVSGQQVDTETITGVVTSSKGPEAGVWVIAETDDPNTKFRKIVVANDDGQFLVPELPQGNYAVWVRGYGLVDSTPVTATPGHDLRLTAVVAKTPQEAAAVYPANYWLSLMEPPKTSEFPGTGRNGNGITNDDGQPTAQDAPRIHVQPEGLPALSSGREQVHARESERARVRLDRRGVG